MLHIYCADCGGKTDYTLNKPSFCSQCGKPFATVKASMSKPIVIPRVEEAQTIEPTEDSSVSLPNLRRIEIAVQIDSSAPGVKLGDIYALEKDVPDSVRRKNIKISSKAKRNIVNTWRQEASSSQPLDIKE